MMFINFYMNSFECMMFKSRYGILFVFFVVYVFWFFDIIKLGCIGVGVI